ncbi:DUF882 domain-containing protein [Falsiroseomonas oryziterrae]|uniref:DUF882 domain-containing protein n=1 Tax=Falsiroseomonas oryziterrae TaxID=2911368 RepID=UPI001F18EF31|nr:DUF882 domain-containing protein [Roseomonas sp. NPKOSM-4]
MRLFHDAACPCCGSEQVAPRGGFGATTGRRGFLAAAVGGAALVTSPVLAQGTATRSLRVRRQVTNEGFDGVYWRNGRYDRDALRQLDIVFRDLSAAEPTPMDPRLFDVMAAVAQAVDSSETWEVVSGYRTPETNAARSRQSRRVSTVSLHMSGMAADCRLPDRSSLEVARRAADLQLGGVGLYRRSGFMHLDCGPVRRW